MKNKNLLFAMPLLLGALILSCQDEVTGSLENKVQDAVFNATVEKAKAIFESKSPDFPVIQSRSADGVEKGIVFEPVWGEAFVANHKDGSTTVETHIRVSQPFHILPQDAQEAYEQTKDSRYLQHLSRSVVLMREEENAEPLAFLMTIAGSKKYMETHDFQLYDVSYTEIPEDFSGMILYHTLAGDFINGWKVEEGRQFSSCEPISDEEANLLSRAISTGQNVACRTETMTKHYYMCRISDLEKDLYATYETNKVPNGTDLNNCTGPHTKTETYQICRLVDESYGSSPGGHWGQVIPYKDLTELFSTYSSDLYAQLQGFMNFMENNDDASRAVLSYINYVKSVSPNAFQKLNVQIDATQSADSRYSAYNHTVYFKSVDRYSDLALYEEIVHALQRVVYTIDEISEGPFNLEFEAKLIIDYVDFVNGNQGDTDMALNMMHADVTLQNGSTMTVAEWIDQYAYSNLNVTDFWNYMRVWKSISYGYQNYMMNPRLQPKLISPIIFEINNN